MRPHIVLLWPKHTRARGNCEAVGLHADSGGYTRVSPVSMERETTEVV